MRVRTLQNIKTPQGDIQTGMIIDIPNALADRLNEKVEVVFPFQGAAEIVTKKGDSIWIATGLEDVKLIPAGAIYFLGEEIELLHQAGKETARAALEVKKVFGNCAKVVGTKIITHERKG